MKKTSFKLLIALGCLALSSAQAAQPTTFLGPTARGAYTGALNEISNYAVIGELGGRNARVNGTMAWQLPCNQRIKFTAEYLYQRLTYNFFTGNTSQWVSQTAIGGNYQYNLGCVGFGCAQIDLTAYASHAPSKTLSPLSVATTPAGGAPVTLTDNRRIAGSNAYGIAPGITYEPVPGTRAGIAINYDNVRYDNIYTSKVTANGIGGTVHLDQALTNCLKLGLLATVRQPFNNYRANLVWTNVPCARDLSLGLFADYTQGKKTLPNSYNVGLSASYLLDCRCHSGCPVNNDFSSYSADPAVFMPQVLAIPDERVGSSCPFGVPTFSGTIGDVTLDAGSLTIATAGFFTGTDLTFSITTTPTPGGGDSVTINSTTGVITVSGGAITEDISVTVTATNPCGSATSNTFIVSFVD